MNKNHPFYSNYDKVLNGKAERVICFRDCQITCGVGSHYATSRSMFHFEVWKWNERIHGHQVALQYFFPSTKGWSTGEDH
jgi:hypothetical protein